MTAWSRNRVRVVVGSLMLLAFIAGVAVGVIGSTRLTPRIRLRSGVEDMSAVFDRLRLTPDQRRQATAIVSGSAPRSREIMLELGQRLQGVADSVDAELRAILTPAQRLTLDSLRSDSRLLLKRKVTTPGRFRTDTLLDTSPDRRRP